MKLFLSILTVLVSPAVGAQPVAAPAVFENMTIVSAQESGNRRPLSDQSDTLRAKRRLFTTDLYLQQKKLTPATIDALLAPAPQAAKAYLWGKRLRPVGPLISLAGLVVGYIGVRGTPGTAIIRGTRTPSNPSPPDVEVTYTSRRLPVVLSGLGLLIGGICLIEVANERIHHSVTLFNASAGPQRSVTSIQTIRFGLTSINSLGVMVQW